MPAELSELCAAVEECYEYLLAYAGQGLSGGEGSRSSGEVRRYLERAAQALAELSECYAATIKSENLQPAESHHSFRAVLENDARNSLAAVELVLARPAISSQLIDNLNASIHLRAVLTDLFLIDEILKPQNASLKPAT